jgi:hypothetical protein
MTQKQLSYSAVQGHLDRMIYSASQEPHLFLFWLTIRYSVH